MASFVESRVTADELFDVSTDRASLAVWLATNEVMIGWPNAVCYFEPSVCDDASPEVTAAQYGLREALYEIADIPLNDTDPVRIHVLINKIGGFTHKIMSGLYPDDHRVPEYTVNLFPDIRKKIFASAQKRSEQPSEERAIA